MCSIKPRNILTLQFFENYMFFIILHKIGLKASTRSWLKYQYQFWNRHQSNLSRLMTNPTKWLSGPTKTQISLGIRPVWSKSSLCAQWVAKDPSFLHADSEDSDQTGRMPRLIWVFAGCTVTLLVLSCRGSFHYIFSKDLCCLSHNHNFRSDTWRAFKTKGSLISI